MARRRYEQNWPPRLRHFAPWRLLKTLWTAFLLNYACSAFVVRARLSLCSLCAARRPAPWRRTRRCPQSTAGGGVLSSPTPTPLPNAQVLTWSDSIAVWRSVHFLGHFVMLLITAAGLAMPPRKHRHQRHGAAGHAAGEPAGAPAGEAKKEEAKKDD
jgi:hypothetical protein